MSTHYPEDLPYLPDLSRVDHTPEYFFRLRSESEDERKQCCEHKQKSIRLWLAYEEEEDDARKLLDAHLPTVLRLSHECPFEDVQHNFSIFLHGLQVNFNFF